MSYRMIRSGARSAIVSSAIVTLLAVSVSVSAVATFTSSASANDRHVDYYYPQPASNETYTAPLPVLPGVTRFSRVGLITQLDQIQKERPYAPTYHMYVKGGDAEKVIIVATGSGRYDTLFRLRGLLASMTADARTSPLFQKLGNVAQLNFFDLLKMAGFKRLTVTNGDDFAHQVFFE
ncbi:MAG: hypothetical protein AAFN43_04950 [Pseudomonadota bacterium]